MEPLGAASFIPEYFENGHKQVFRSRSADGQENDITLVTRVTGTANGTRSVAIESPETDGVKLAFFYESSGTSLFNLGSEITSTEGNLRTTYEGGRYETFPCRITIGEPYTTSGHKKQVSTVNGMEMETDLGEFTETVTFLGYEEVTVPAGTFLCLKSRSETEHTQSILGSESIISIVGTVWLAPGVGQVKSVTESTTTVSVAGMEIPLESSEESQELLSYESASPYEPPSTGNSIDLCEGSTTGNPTLSSIPGSLDISYGPGLEQVTLEIGAMTLKTGETAVLEASPDGREWTSLESYSKAQVTVDIDELVGISPFRVRLFRLRIAR